MIERNINCLSTKLNEASIILNTETGRYIELNETGSLIWEKIETPIEIDSLISFLVQEYNIDPETCKKETKIFLSECKEAGLLI